LTDNYIKLPSFLGGLIVQWKLGASDHTQGLQTITFPIAFPTACFGVVVSAQLTDNPGIEGADVWYQTKRYSSAVEFATDHIDVYCQWSGTGSFPTDLIKPFIIAIGK